MPSNNFNIQGLSQAQVAASKENMVKIRLIINPKMPFWKL